MPTPRPAINKIARDDGDVSRPATHSSNTSTNRKAAATDKVTADEQTVIFIKDEITGKDASEFQRVVHRGSITLEKLTRDHNVTSVLECESDGTSCSRGVLISSPGAVLHKGRHYIVRRHNNTTTTTTTNTNTNTNNCNKEATSGVNLHALFGDGSSDDNIQSEISRAIRQQQEEKEHVDMLAGPSNHVTFHSKIAVTEFRLPSESTCMSQVLESASSSSETSNSNNNTNALSSLPVNSSGVSSQNNNGCAANNSQQKQKLTNTKYVFAPFTFDSPSTQGTEYMNIERAKQLTAFSSSSSSSLSESEIQKLMIEVAGSGATASDKMAVRQQHMIKYNQSIAASKELLKVLEKGK